jgi:hypothetical protein
MVLFIAQFSPASYYFLPLGTIILLSTLFPTFSQCSDRKVTNQVPHPHKSCKVRAEHTAKLYGQSAVFLISNLMVCTDTTGL